MNVSTAAMLGGVLLVALAGCSTAPTAGPSASTDGPTATPMASTPAKAPTNGSPAEHNDADTVFAQMMTVHHEGALEMSALAVEKAESKDVGDLAATIEAAQEPEIELMQSWLTAWDEPLAPSGHAGMDHGGMDMNGMTQEQVMAELQQESGAGFDEQFLTAMIAHHEGAVMMADVELSTGQNADALDLARRIIDAQESEIEQMKQLVQDL
ncbi:DUF305 domain-containing protein [Tessaracoccus sp.]